MLFRRSAELADEVFVADVATACLVKVANDLFGLLIAQVVTEVNHGPAEILCINLISVDGTQGFSNGVSGTLLFYESTQIV